MRNVKLTNTTKNTEDIWSTEYFLNFTLIYYYVNPTQRVKIAKIHGYMVFENNNWSSMELRSTFVIQKNPSKNQNKTHRYQNAEQGSKHGKNQAQCEATITLALFLGALLKQNAFIIYGPNISYTVKFLLVPVIPRL